MSAVVGGPPAAVGLRRQAAIWWQARTPRERQLMALVGCVLGFFVVWSLFVQPALQTVRQAPAELDRLDAQLQRMQRVADESGALRATPRVAPSQAAQAMRAAAAQLGDRARLTLQGDRATLTLVGVDPEALRAFLVEARSGARARPNEAQLQRAAQGYTGSIGFTVGGAS